MWGYFGPCAACVLMVLHITEARVICKSDGDFSHIISHYLIHYSNYSIHCYVLSSLVSHVAL